MFADIQVIETLKMIDEILSKIETYLENHNERKERDPNHNECEEECGPLIPYRRWKEQDPDDQYMKSIKLDVLNFDGRLDP